MGCNCKVNNEILKLHKEYGQNVQVPWRERAKFKLIEGIKLAAALLLIIPLLPLVFIFVLVSLIKGKGRIDVNKTLRILLRKNG